MRYNPGEIYETSQVMSPHRYFLKYRFIFIVIATLLIIPGLAAFLALGLAIFDPGDGNKAARNPTISSQSLALLQRQLLVEPASQAGSNNMPIATPTPQEFLPAIPESQRGLLTNGSRDEYKVALTFDLCETEEVLAGYDSEIVRILNETQTPATLFLGGLWMRNHEAETLELGRNPLFELGNHSWSHKDFSAISREEMVGQILRTQETMYDLLGFETNLFRLPYGTYTDEALDLINDHGLYIIQWDDVSGDPDPEIDAREMTAWVLQQVQPGSMIIMHANGRGWHTAEALPGIIRSLREQGFSLVKVSELLKIQPYK